MSLTRGFRLPPDIGTRLDNLAQKTGRTKTYYATKAITQFLNNQEELLLTLSDVENQGPAAIRPAKYVVRQLKQQRKTRQPLEKVS